MQAKRLFVLGVLLGVVGAGGCATTTATTMADSPASPASVEKAGLCPQNVFGCKDGTRYQCLYDGSAKTCRWKKVPGMCSPSDGTRVSLDGNCR